MRRGRALPTLVGVAAVVVLTVGATVALPTGNGPVADAQVGPLPFASDPASEESDDPASEASSATPSPDATTPPTTDPTTCRDEPSTNPIVRLSGEDRAATAACASAFAYPDGAPLAVIARGDAAGGLADALAGTVLAHARSAPVLLVTPSTLPDATRQELERLDATRVVVLGGTTAVRPAVARELETMGLEVARLAGSSRAGTAAAIAAEVDSSSVFVVNGRRPADALVAGAAAAREGAALLLVETDAVPDDTTEALADVDDVTIVGGFGVVGDAVDRALRRAVPDVRRLGGASRYETAATVARAHPGAGTVHLVAGADANLVDAIAGGWLGARADGGPVAYLATDHVPRGTDRWLRLGGLGADTPVRLLGGEAALGPSVVTALDDRYDEARAGGPPAQVRGIWIHLFDDSLKSRAGIETVLDTATRANLNTVVVQVVRRSDAFYDSDVLPRTFDPDFPADLDLLDELLPAAHARGLQVHAWFSVTPSDHSTFEDEVLPADHVNVLHGPESDDPWTATVNLPNYDYLDPAIPGVQDHIVGMVREVAERYDVDGIHLDYLRYGGQARTDLDPPGVEHPVTEARYAAHGRDSETMREFMGAQTQDLARRIRLEVAEVAPDTIISAAVLAQGQGPTAAGGFEQTRTWAQKAQGWPSWVEEGILDHAYPMLYFDQDTHGDWFEDWRRFAIDLDDDTRVIAPGLGSYLNDDTDNLAQTRAVTEALDGAVIFSHQSEGLGAGTAYLQALPTDLFATPAPVPVLPRNAEVTRGHLLVSAEDGDDVTVTGPSGERITRRADATGHAGFVLVAPGTWEVRRGGATTDVTVEVGRVTRVAAP